MDFTGRSMRGFVYVGAAGLADSAALRKWVTLGIQHALATPKRKRAPADATARQRK
jgi:hypothetical protein